MFTRILIAVTVLSIAVSPHLVIADDFPEDDAPEFVLLWGGLGSTPGLFNLPLGIDVDAQGNVYVADYGNHRIQKFDNNGIFLTQWGSQGSLPGQFNWPEGVAIDQHGNVYVADRDNHRIQKFDLDGNFVSEWGNYCDVLTGDGCVGDGRGQFNSPWAVGVDDAGDVYVVEFLNHRIQKFNSEGEFVLMWGGLGTGDGQFDVPQGVAIDSQGFVYVSDHNNNRVQKFSSEGQFVSKWGSFGTSPGQFWGLSGLETDNQDRIYVADQLNYRVQVFNTSGQYLYHFGYRQIAPGGLGAPWDVAIDQNGNAFVSEKDHNRISKFGIPEPQEPRITQIADVGMDQGGKVRINFLRSRFDLPGAYPQVEEYEVYRRIDPGRKANQLPTTQLAGWEFVGAVPPHFESEYNIVVPTIVDKKKNGDIPWTAFFVRAATTNPGTFFDSAPDSGYSADNIPPGNPRNLKADPGVGAAKVSLVWEQASEPGASADRWQVFRGPFEDFAMDGESFAAEIKVTEFTDDGILDLGWQRVSYKVVGVDASGNASEPATITIDAVGTHGQPSNFSFSMANNNPVSDVAVLSYYLPYATPIEIKVYDAGGRLVATPFAGILQVAGNHAWEWNLQDSLGKRVSSGIYFSRFATPTFSRTVKTVVLR